MKRIKYLTILSAAKILNRFINKMDAVKMKIKITVFLFILFVCALNSCDGKPVAYFNETTHDFGKVKASSTVTHTFTFTNRGTSTLIIERVKAG